MLLEILQNWLFWWITASQPASVNWSHQNILEWEGTIEQIVKPGKIWRVKCQATLWSARSRQLVNFCPGDWVRVVDRQGLILFIEPLEEANH